MLSIEIMNRIAMNLACFGAKYPQGITVILVVIIEHMKLKLMNVIASAVVDFAANEFIIGKNTTFADIYVKTPM